MYLTRKSLLKTIVDIFIENPNKANMLHSTILELFDYLTKEPNKKIACHLLQNYSELLFKAPKHEQYFRHFVNQYEDKASIACASSFSGTSSLGKGGMGSGLGMNDRYMKWQRESLKK